VEHVSNVLVPQVEQLDTEELQRVITKDAKCTKMEIDDLSNDQFQQHQAEGWHHALPCSDPFALFVSFVVV
jgi:hypothetical protein